MTKDTAPIVFLLGLLFFMSGFIPFIYYLNLYFNRTQTMAEVTDYEGKNYMFLKFLNSNNILIESRVNVSGHKEVEFLFPIGSKIAIFYSSTSNKSVVLKSKFWGTVFFFGIFVAMGLMVIILAISKMDE